MLYLSSKYCHSTTYLNKKRGYNSFFLPFFFVFRLIYIIFAKIFKTKLLLSVTNCLQIIH